MPSSRGDSSNIQPILLSSTRTMRWSIGSDGVAVRSVRVPSAPTGAADAGPDPPTAHGSVTGPPNAAEHNPADVAALSALPLNGQTVETVRTSEPLVFEGRVQAQQHFIDASVTR